MSEPTDAISYTRARQRVGKVPLSTKFYQGIGALPDTYQNFAFNTFLLFFYTTVVGLPGTVTGAVIDYFKTFPAREIEGRFIEDGYLYFECRHYKTIDGFGENCLITGEIVAAWGDDDFLRRSQADDQETIHESPLFAYLPPGRFATIDRSNAFPFPESMRR